MDEEHGNLDEIVELLHDTDDLKRFDTSLKELDLNSDEMDNGKEVNKKMMINVRNMNS